MHTTLARLSVLAALGRDAKLRRELRRALSEGVPIRQIHEAFLQLYLFAGFPRMINAFFALEGPPLADDSWTEHVLTQVPWPINSYAVDLDSDGDIDIVGGSVAQGRMMWFENRSTAAAFELVEHAIEIAVDGGVEAASGRGVATVNGFHTQFVDLNDDGRLDIVTFDTGSL